MVAIQAVNVVLISRIDLIVVKKDITNNGSCLVREHSSTINANVALRELKPQDCLLQNR